MQLLICLLLGAGLAFALLSLWRQRQRTQELYHSVLKKQPCLLDKSLVGGSDSTWGYLCQAINDLTEDVQRLQTLRSGQLAQLQATLGSLQEGVLIVDQSNRILLANKSLESIFARATNVLGQRLELVLQSSSFLKYVEQVRTNTAPARHEVEFTEGNRSIWIEVTGSPIPSLDGDKGSWALFVLHDVTTQKKLEAVRKEFVANVSHELRTPVSVIKGYVETLVDGHRDMPLEDRERFLATVQRHTERLASLLEDILLLSRLESVNPGLRRESTELTPLMMAVVEDFKTRPAASGHLLSAQLAPDLGSLLVDPLKLSQAVENLIDNAIKYTPKGSMVEVRAQRTEQEILISVSDNGPGIPPADLPHIFERFYRVEKGRSRDKGGTGLGLSIMKHIVQLHGGQARVESQVGKGTTFTLTLPFRVAAPASTRPPVSA